MIDFGSSTFDDGYHSAIVSTRHYRAPEIVLGTGWSYECDIWSLGCILVELLIGDALFQTHENLEHLAMMENVLGPIPLSVVQRTSTQVREQYFTQRGRLAWPDKAENAKSLRAVAAMKKLKELLQSRCDASVLPYLDVLVDLLKSMLMYEKEKRCTAEQALAHRFFSIPL